MIHTDGIRTIANAPTYAERRRQRQSAAWAAHAARRRPPVLGQVSQAELDSLAKARALREAALRSESASENASALASVNRGPQANGQQWNDDVCICGGIIADSPAGDKCWDCFNHEPGE